MATASPVLDEEPVRIVQRLQQELGRVAGDPSLDFHRRRAELESAVRETHDLPHIARLVGGRHWRGWSPQQREQFKEKFGRLTVALYAGRFAGSGPLEFHPLDQAAMPRGVVRVSSELATAEDGVVEFEYLLHRSEGHWRIINILIDGVSDLALRRSQYADIAEDGGLEALLEHLDREIAALEAP